jgi:predicted nucleic acid-binding Zn ribbon protein
MSPRWRPLDEDRGPRKIGDGLDRVLPGGKTFRVLREQWPELVGESFASHARPSSIEAKTLVIAVDDAAFASQFKWMESDLLERLAEALGEGIVTSLRVVVRPS